MHPVGALAVGYRGRLVRPYVHAGAEPLENRRCARRLAPARPVGAWGGIAAGIFGSRALGGIGGISLGAQVAGTLAELPWR